MTFSLKRSIPDLQRYPCNLCLIKYELDINVFVSLNCLFSLRYPAKVICAFPFSQETHRNKHNSSQKNDGIFHIFSVKGFKGTVVIRALSSLYIGSPNITLSVPLIITSIVSANKNTLNHLVEKEKISR